MSTESAISRPVTVTPRAAKQFAKIIAAEGKPMMLRLSISGGGCSGFQYNFSLDDKQLSDDLVIEEGGIKVLVDSTSINYVEGSEIDYVDDLIGAAFKVNNPNATASCGCGSSFSI
ncbi:iron-sulfur cluster assembly accessory protein [Rhizomicrobium palustre]|uniref:Iron-sulfur cluster assembly accessory protein n=1 Tax=Rhizomicrobium palustre TaxID=189966 RepID=A0A846N2Q3_9PROT|nr:iron-sulfur cluster insertion protein ErpA [Rhizomicrobium palustre]NIK90208.1 iron-sulfur cluster assembly accessory protein [Rhizomicrobium palustre]